MQDSAKCVTDKDAPAPEYLIKAMRTRTYGLPYAGGWMEQPAGEITRMDICMSAYDAYKSFKSAPAGTKANWQKRNPDQWSIVTEILDLV